MGEMGGSNGSVKLREHLEKLCCVRMAAHSDRMQAHQREHELIADALNKAEAIMNQRLGGMNELRDQINRERGVYVTREIMDAMISTQATRISAVEHSLWLAIGAVALAAFLVPLGIQFIR